MCPMIDMTYQICSDDQQHHYVTATRPVAEGTVILEELPLIVGPSDSTSTCLGCHSLMPSTSYCCKKCKWPLCSEQCQKSPLHVPECYFRSRRIADVGLNCIPQEGALVQHCVTALRCLYQKEFFPTVWEKLNKLESHYEKRKLKDNYDKKKKEFMDALYRHFGLKAEFTENEILKVWGIILTNQEHAPISTISPVAIYEKSPAFEHNCQANCCKFIDSQGVLRVVAGVAISEGERLTINYSNALWATFNRQLNLTQTKFFQCSCSRCIDLTEFGLYISAMRCQRIGCHGYLLPYVDSYWICDACSYGAQEHYIGMLFDYLRQQRKRAEQLFHLTAFKQYVEMYKKYLPENHSYFLQVKLYIIYLIGGLEPESMYDVSEENLMLKTMTCYGLINLLKKIAPAEKKLLGFLLFHMELSMEEVDRRERLAKGVDVSLESLKLYKALLDKVVRYLKYQSIYTIEGKLCTLAIRKSKCLEEVIAEIGSD